MRPESGLLFVDESGQLRPPWDGRPFEIGVLAGLLIPDTKRDRDALKDLVSQLRRCVFGTREYEVGIKGRMLEREAYGLIARAIRKRWVFGYLAMEIAHDSVSDLKGTFRMLLQDIEHGRKKLGFDKRLDLRLDYLKRRGCPGSR